VNAVISKRFAKRHQMKWTKRVSSISLFDGLPIAEIDGLPTSASRLR